MTSHHPRFFITGTDTGIGKTFVSAVLTLGLQARYWKPIQTGSNEGTDRAWMQQTAQIPPQYLLPEAYCLKAPLSPHLAAELESMEIDLADCRIPPEALTGPLIVEGAGGVLVPINAHTTMIDLMDQLQLPVLIVARSTLGTINHTLLTIEALRARRIPVAGVVLNGPSNPGNRRSIEFYGHVPIVAEIEKVDVINRDSLKSLYTNFFSPLMTHARPLCSKQ